jgi:lipoxygenase
MECTIDKETHCCPAVYLVADDKAWQNNDEFARQFLAGLNPVVIELVTEFPLKSSLDPAEFGDPTSAISEDHVIGELEGLSVQQVKSVTLAKSERAAI